ncbi:MAG: SEC-C domain-containing protein [Deltaproteobacteria bacterium]|nr:SEC-C domain-containing protein [Candidatus Anaeroferrophillus wilburensis]MBN2887896.1 SEC-C domain-containing protein [Deltaproteobacteria bacterium]
MARIGRNDPCPCGSGLKYKKCCLGKAGSHILAAAEKNKEASLGERIATLQEKAVAGQQSLYTLGAFILFTTTAGDGWVLDITEMDAVQVASNGTILDIVIDESPETIEINWTNRFAIKERNFVTTSYADNTVRTWEGYPTHGIASAMKKVKKKFTPEMLQSIHHDEDEPDIDHEL